MIRNSAASKEAQTTDTNSELSDGTKPSVTRSAWSNKQDAINSIMFVVSRLDQAMCHLGIVCSKPIGQITLEQYQSDLVKTKQAINELLVKEPFLSLVTTDTMRYLVVSYDAAGALWVSFREQATASPHGGAGSQREHPAITYRDLLIASVALQFRYVEPEKVKILKVGFEKALDLNVMRVWRYTGQSVAFNITVVQDWSYLTMK